MDFETAKNVAAFGGLGLGLLNFGMSIYKDFLRQGKIIAEIEKSHIKWRGGGEYDFLIVLNVRATGKDVYLKDMWLAHPTKVFGPSLTSSVLHIKKITKYVVKDLLEQNKEEYEAEVNEIFQDAELIRDMYIKEAQQKTLTITGRFYSERLTDGWLEVPLTRWRIVVGYGKHTIEIPFAFHNIDPSESYVYHEWNV